MRAARGLVQNGMLPTLSVIALVAGLCGEASAVGIKLSGGVVRLVDGADVKDRILMTRGNSIILVLPAESVTPQVLKGEGPFREVRLQRRANRLELDLRLSERAEAALPRLRLTRERGDLLIRLDPPAAATTPALAPAASPPTKPAEGATPQAPRARPDPATPPPVRATAGLLAPRPGGWVKDQRAPASGGTSIWLLLVAISATGGALWWFRRRKRGALLEGAQIEIVSCRAISGKQRLVLVEAAGELLLLGCTEKEIRLLHAVDRRRFQDRQENEFFAEGLRMDAESAADDAQGDPAPARPAPQVDGGATQDAPRGLRSDAVRLADRLTRKIRERTLRPAAPPVEEEPPPLDERWALGILKLRKARSSSSSSSSTMH